MKNKYTSKRTHTIEYWDIKRENGERFYSRTFAEGVRDLAEQINSIVKSGCHMFRIWNYADYKKEKNIKD